MKSTIKRATGLLVYEVSGANPNGNPDGSFPRQTNDGRGWVSNVSIKRKIRDILDNHSSPIFQAIQEQLKFDPETMHIFESRHRGLVDPKGKDAVKSMNMILEMGRKNPAALLDRCWDARVNGITLLPENKKDGVKEEGDKPKKAQPADADVPVFRIAQSGPFSIANGFSIGPVDVVEATLTRKAPLRKGHLEMNDGEGQGDMAPMAMKFVNHGVYCHRFGVNPQMVEASRTTEMDIKVLRTLFPQIFTSSTSLTRPLGSINLLHIFWAEHESPLGSFPESKFFDSLTPKRKNNPTDFTSSLDEYIIPEADAFKNAKVEDLI